MTAVRWAWLALLFLAEVRGQRDDISECQLDLVFIIDGSGSVCNDVPGWDKASGENCAPWNMVISFMESIIEDFNINDDYVRVAAIVFGNSARVHWDLNSFSNKSSLLAEVAKLRWPDGNTNTQLALTIARTEVFTTSRGDRSGVENIAIVVTDGASTIDPNNTVPAAEQLRLDKSVRMYAVGVGAEVNLDELKSISSPPRTKDKNYFETPSFDTLETLQDDLVDRSCQDSESCNRLDLCFIVDGSGSICQEDGVVEVNGIDTCDNWELIKGFIEDLTSTFDVGTSAVRVAVVSFANRGVLLWDLTAYTSKSELVPQIRRMAYPDGNTNTSGGLVVTREEVFVIAGGDRPNIPNVAIVVTDGKSTRDTELTVLNAVRLRQESDAVVFAVGVTNEINEDELRDISSEPQRKNQNWFTTPNFNTMAELLEPVSENTCSIPETPTPYPGCAQQIDMVFVIDGSKSIRESEGTSDLDNWFQILNFIRIGISHWPGDGVRVGPNNALIGVVVFGNDAVVQMQFGEHDNFDDFAAAIRAIPYPNDENKNTAAGLRMAQEMLLHDKNRPKVPDVVVLITDGPPDVNEDELAGELDRLHDKAQVFVLGVTVQSNEEFVRAVASEPKEINKQYWRSVNFASLESFLTSVETGIWDYLCGGVSQEPEPPIGSACELDIAILVDASGSIRNSNPADQSFDNWDELKKSLVLLVDELYKRLQGSGTEHRIAMVRFSTSARVDWPLDQFVRNRTGLNDAIQAMMFDGHLTNTPEALQITREDVFHVDNGDRPGAPNLAIIFTDGKPQKSATEFLVEETVEQAELLRNASTRIMAVGITSEVIQNPISRETLMRMSSPPQKINQNYWITLGFRTIEAIVEQLANQACDPEPDRCTVDVIFVLDYSGSIGKDTFIKIREFIAALIDQTDVGDSTRVGAVTFSDNSRHQFHLNKYTERKEAVNDVNGIPFRGGRTHTAEALRYARTDMFTDENGDRPDVMNVAVVVTDGGSNVPDKESVIAEAQLLKQSGVHVIAVGVGKWLDEYELNAIASYPYSVNTIILPDRDTLFDARDRVKALFCNDVDECAAGVCENGGTCVDGIGVYWCFCEENFVGQRCQTACREKADVVFALDSSGSVKKHYFQKEVDFVSDLVLHGLSLSDDFHRVGAQHYATDVNVGFNLNDFSTKANVLSALGFHYRGGTTNTAEAIRVLSEDMFSRGEGDRDGVPNVGVVITDGRSNNPSLTWENAKEAREGGLHLMTVGIGSNIRKWELEGIVSGPVHSNMFSVADFDSFDSVRESLTDAICNNVDDCEGSPCGNGGTCEDRRGGYVCHCLDDFTGNRCLRECSGELDLIIVLDSSGSMRSRRFLLVLQFIVNIVRELQVGSDMTRIGMISYSDTATVAFHLDRYTAREDVINHIQRVKYQGDRTNTAQALTIMIDDMFRSGNGDREDVRNMALVITNANSNINEEDTLPEAIRAMVQGIHMVAVGVGHDVDWMELRGLASYPQSATVFHARSQNDLPGLVEDLVNTTCDDEDACEDNPCENRARCLDLMNDYYCQCSFVLTGKNCDFMCAGQMDIVFVLDISGSVDTVYHVITNFTRRMILGLSMEQQRAKVGIITFSNEARVHNYLDEYVDKQSLLSSLAFSTAGGRTNTQAALNLLHTDVFTVVNGDRVGVANRAVVVTDGRSNIEHSNTAREAEDARDAGIEIYVVAVGNNVDRGEANDIASNPDSSHVYDLVDVDVVDRVSDFLLQELCQ